MAEVAGTVTTAGFVGQAPVVPDANKIPDPPMNVFVDFICRRMRGESVTLPGLPPR